MKWKFEPIFKSIGAKDNKRLRPFFFMGSLKVIVDDDVERQFRRVAMKRYGYGKGALSQAAEAALGDWSSREDTDTDIPQKIMQDPVGAIEGLLKGVKRTSVELQHEVTRLRVKKADKKASD